MVVFVFSPMGSKSCRPVVFLNASHMAEASRPEMNALEAAAVATPAEGAEGTVSVPSGIGAAEGSIPAEAVVPVVRAADPPGGASPARALTPGTPVETGEEKARSARGSPKDQAASDPEDEFIEVEERQPKRQKLHKELRNLSVQLGNAVTSMDATTKAMGTMMEQFQQQAAEISQTAMQLGLTGVSATSIL